MRLIPVHADADIDYQWHAQGSPFSHQARQLGADPGQLGFRGFQDEFVMHLQQ